MFIKKKNIQDLDKQKHILNELKFLEKTLFDIVGDNKEVNDYLDKLVDINSKLWKIEDDIREFERMKKFEDQFIELARSVYLTNDERSKIKLEINKKFGSKIIEMKSYKEY